MKIFTLFSIILLLYLIQIITIINAQLRPSVRKLHNAVLVDKKLYIFGGFHDLLTDTIEKGYNLVPDDRFFYLDVSKTFDTSILPWTAIPDNAINLPLLNLSTVFSGGVSASIGGINNDTIFFINNNNPVNNQNIPPVNTFNTKTNLWISQNIFGDVPIGTNQMKGITDYNGKIYLLTGFNFTTDQGIARNNGIFILDTIKLSCTVQDAPISRLDYAATLLPNGIIVYIAGQEAGGNLIPNNFNVIYLYDTTKNTDNWQAMITKGNVPTTSDNGISSVLGLNGDRIIVFGGHNNNNNNNFIYVLDTTTWEWNIPNIKGKGPRFIRNDHSANVIGEYMIITFGKFGLLDFSYRENGESDVLLLNISNDSEYEWVTSFDPNAIISSPPSKTSSSPAPSSSDNNNNNNKDNIKAKKDDNTGLIIGIVLGSGGINILIGTIYYFIKRRKKIKESAKFIPTPGGVANEHVITIPSDQDSSSYGRSGNSRTGRSGN
ncbi:hypothetical protein C1645_750826 [Glomus cerebriforme]|uniref:Galactose oxidase n=1 Tax=Glomus cerebriforme TaxID=658196 RepID=A0A397TNT6_9GLOM|nr:hypothetical protein C1645_750826 [Glomus cerebriforme]